MQSGRRRDRRGWLAPALWSVAVGLAGTSAGLHARPLQSSGEVALASQLVYQGLEITTDTPVLQAAMAWSSQPGRVKL